MEPLFFFKGAILGFSIAAPVGPIGVLCIRRTLQSGRLSGLFSGLGAALADTLYGVIAAFGLTFVSDLLLTQQVFLRLAGGTFLFYLGVKTFFAKTAPLQPPHLIHRNLWMDLISTFFLTISNPLTIFSFAAVFAGFGLIDEEESLTNAFWLIGGIFGGSSLWWLILSEGVTYFRSRVTKDAMSWINRCAGMLITGFALFAWFSILHIKKCTCL